QLHHLGEVDHKPVITDAVSGGVVPAAANGDLKLIGGGQSRTRSRRLRGRRIARSPWAGDRRVEAAARRVVLRVRLTDDLGLTPPPTVRVFRPSAIKRPLEASPLQPRAGLRPAPWGASRASVAGTSSSARPGAWWPEAAPSG